MLTMVSAALFALNTYAEQYPYLSFLTTDGTVLSFATTSLTMTVADGKLVIKNDNESGSISLESLSKMYFSSSPTAVSGIKGNEESSSAKVYDISGKYLGTLGATGLDGSQFAPGTYIIKENGKTKKLIKQ